MPYSVYRHEGGKKMKVDGPFDTEAEAQEVCDRRNKNIDIALGGFQVHED